MYNTNLFVKYYQATLNFFGYFEKLAEMFRSLGRLCPVFKEFQEIFSESVKLRESLLEFYTIVVKFCTEALRFLKEKRMDNFSSLFSRFSFLSLLGTDRCP